MRWRARREKPAGFARKLFLMGLGAVLVVLGAVMLVLPGPGLLVLLIGTALIAEESLFVARLVDRVDLAFARGLQRWRARRAMPADSLRMSDGKSSSAMMIWPA